MNPPLDVLSQTIWPDTNERLPPFILERLAAGASNADAVGVLSANAVEDLRQAGYFALPVPIELRGGGAGLLDCAAVQRRLAMADPALAIAGNMHLFSVGMAVEHWRRRHDLCGLLLEAIATTNLIVASAFSEPGLTGDLLRSNLRASRVSGGWRVSGTKSPCSLAEYCDLICFQMASDMADAAIMIALVPSRDSGIVVEPTWDSLGMRASGSQSIHMSDLFVPDNLVFHASALEEPLDEVIAGGLIWFWIMTTATYIGVARSALDIACSRLSGAPDNGRETNVDSDALIKIALAEQVSQLVVLEASCSAVAAWLDGGAKPLDLAPIALSTKHAAVGICSRLVEECAEALGGASYVRTSAMSRLWRDVQAIHYHPPTRNTTRRLLGEWMLGTPFSTL